MSAGHRSPKPGSEPPPTRPSKSRITSPAICGNSPVSRIQHPTVKVVSANSAGTSPSARFGGRSPQEQKQLYVDRQFQAGRDRQTAVKRVVLFVLTSPRFLYREIGGSNDAYDVATRISFALWDSLPDAQLLEAAAKGQLATRTQVISQAERMVTDLRTHAKLRAFFLQWLKIEQNPDLAKDSARFPGFDRAAASDLRTSLDLFLENVLWSDASDFPPTPTRGLFVPQRPAGSVLRGRSARPTHLSTRFVWNRRSVPAC